MPPKRPVKPTGRRVVPDDGSTPAEEGHTDETPQAPQAPQPPPTLVSESVEAAVPAQPIAEHVPQKKKVGRPRKNVAPSGETGASEPPPATSVATGEQERSAPSEVTKPKKRGRKKAGSEEATIATGKPANETEDVPAANESLASGDKVKRKPGRPRKDQQRQEGGTQGEAATRVEGKTKRGPGRPRKDPTTESGVEVAKTASQPSGAETAPAEKPRKKIGRPRKSEQPVSDPLGAQQQEQEQPHDASHNVQHDGESANVGQTLSDPQPNLEEEPQPSVESTTAPMSTTTTTTTTTITTTTTTAPAEAAAPPESQKARRKVGRPRKPVAQESTIAATDAPQAVDAIADSNESHQRGRKRAHSQSEGDSQAPVGTVSNVDTPPAKIRRRPGRPKKSEVQNTDEPAAEGSSVQPQEETSADVGTAHEKPKRERKPFDLHTMPLPKPQGDNAKSTPQEQSSTNVPSGEQQGSEQTGKSRRGRKKKQPPAAVDEQDVEGTEASAKDMDTDAPRVSKKRGRPRKQPEAPPSTTAQKRRAVDEEQAAEQTDKPAETDEQGAASPPQKKNKSEHMPVATEEMIIDPSSSTDSQNTTNTRQEQLEALQARRLAASRANRDEVFAEHQRAKTSPRMQAQHERKRAEAEKILEREQIEKAGGDYERHRSWTYTAEEAERWDEQQEIKAKRAETGFSDYNQMAQKKYERQMREFKPDLQAYEEQKRIAMEDPSVAAGEENFYRDANSLSFASVDNKPSREAVDRLVSDVQKQEERREKYSRQRPVNEEDDITYINERNRRFNDKIDRFYGNHTKEIRENFERGTAL